MPFSTLLGSEFGKEKWLPPNLLMKTEKKIIFQITLFENFWREIQISNISKVPPGAGSVPL